MHTTLTWLSIITILSQVQIIDKYDHYTDFQSR